MDGNLNRRPAESGVVRVREISFGERETVGKRNYAHHRARLDLLPLFLFHNHGKRVEVVCKHKEGDTDVEYILRGVCEIPEVPKLRFTSFTILPDESDSTVVPVAVFLESVKNIKVLSDESE